jgi:hypothetical protein
MDKEFKELEDLFNKNNLVSNKWKKIDKILYKKIFNFFLKNFFFFSHKYNKI